MKYKSGFVTIIGNPNVGKSTLFNNLLDYELSIVTSKSQTTRDSIKGIITTDNYQIVLSDTPGHVEASYKLHSKMNKNIFSSLEGSDLIIYVTDIYEKTVNNRLIEAVNKLKIPIYFLVNKKDQLKEKEYLPSVEHSTFSDYDMVSADDKDDCKMILKKIVSYLPIHSPYYLNDDLTNKSERFIVSEIIRKEVFELYKKEVPYSTHIATESFKNEEKLLSIYCYVYVETESQKMIVLGKKGSKIKIIGTNSRKKIEKMYDKKVFIDIGYRKSSLSIFDKNRLILFNIIPLGGNHITKDISQVLGISEEDSESIKKSLNQTESIFSDDSKKEFISNSKIKNKLKQNISLDLLKKVIHARIDEILNLSLKNINFSSLINDKNKCILVFTGEGSKILDKNSIYLENKFNFFREMNFFEESVSTICQSGYNFNKKNYLYEVNIVSKKLKKNGFFEKLFHFFN